METSSSSEIKKQEPSSYFSLKGKPGEGEGCIAFTPPSADRKGGRGGK